MAGHGPPPIHPDQRRRRNSNAAQVTKLPRNGREGTTPKFPIPLASGITAADTRVLRKLETDLWRDLWKLPQAVAWEQQRYTREVAQYVRFKVLGELGDLDSAKEARMLSDRLGLTPLAMKHLLWEIDTSDEVSDARDRHTAPRSSRRLVAVDPAGAR